MERIAQVSGSTASRVEVASIVKLYEQTKSYSPQCTYYYIRCARSTANLHVAGSKRRREEYDQEVANKSSRIKTEV